MKNSEQVVSPQGETTYKKTETEQEKKAQLILRYIENKVIGKHETADKAVEEDLSKRYLKMTTKEKSEELYTLMMDYQIRKQRAVKGKKDKADIEFKTNPKSISRIKVLFSDQKVRELLPSTYGQSRVDAIIWRTSKIGRLWQHNIQQAQRKKQEREILEKNLFHKKIKEEDVLETEKEIADLSLDIECFEEEIMKIETLKGLPKTQENTDLIAMRTFEKLQQYQKQLKKGFVWLPSREKIDEKAMKIITSQGNPSQTRQGVFFLSEPGSGKTEQIRAIAQRLTGHDSVKIGCGPKMGKPQLLGGTKVFPGAEEIEKGTYEDLREAVSSAWTGYDYSYEKEPIRDYAEVVEFDEFPKSFGNENAFAIFKGLYALRDGDNMPGTDKPVLPGRIHFASGNLGIKYGASEIPKAIDRHYEVIPVDYPEMSKENPELYEFMLSSLGIDESGYISVSKKEMAPAYKKRELPENEKEILPDKSVVVAIDELVDDPTNIEHGFLYRLAYAIKSCQNSYMAMGGENAYIDYTKRDLLKFHHDDKDNIYISDTGEQITLATAITLNDIAGWLMSYEKEKRRTKKISTLTEWIQGQLKEKASKRTEDTDKMMAIFNHFHLFDKPIDIDIENEKPLTPKEIGYLSPRVPRPVYIEKPIMPSPADQEIEEEPEELKEKALQVLLENGVFVSIKEKEISIDGESVNLGEKMRIKGEDFSFAGIVEDVNSPHNGKPVGKLASGEELYSVFNVEELDLGILTFCKEAMAGETGIDDFKEDLIDYWESEGCKKDIGEFAF